MSHSTTQSSTSTCCTCGCTVHRFAQDAPTPDQWLAIWDARHWCGPCLRKEQSERKAKRRAAGEQAGRDYWASRGIPVGAKVIHFARSWTGLGGTQIDGTAKIGVNGAYVSAPSYDRRQLDPDAFRLPEGGAR